MQRGRDGGRRGLLLEADAVEALAGRDGVGDGFNGAIAEESLEREPGRIGEIGLEFDKIGMASKGLDFELELAAGEQRLLDFRRDRARSGKRETPTVADRTLV